MVVRQNLDLDVTGLLDVFLDENSAIAKTRPRLAARPLETFSTLIIILSDPHALTAPTGGGLEDHRIANCLRNLNRLLGAAENVRVTGDSVNRGFFGKLLSGHFVTHRFYRPRPGSNEGDRVLA